LGIRPFGGDALMAARKQKIILFVEGELEKEALPEFLRTWLNASHNKSGIELRAINMGGAGNYIEELPEQFESFENDEAVLGFIGLLDLYRLDEHLTEIQTVSGKDAKLAKAKKLLESKVKTTKKFEQHFAVQETEAWFFTIPETELGVDLGQFKSKPPENIEKPADELKTLFAKKEKSYSKVTTGKQLFKKLNADDCKERCPNMKTMLTAILKLTN
jgi:hypothetical protein